MKNRTFTILMALAAFACAPVNKVTVTNLHDLAKHQENSLVYALPRTRVKVMVKAARHHTVPGPYNAYAQKYLGIKDAPSSPVDKYEIINVELNCFREADPDYYYSLTSTNPGEALQYLFNFRENGLILDGKEFIAFSEFHPTGDQSGPVHFLDLSIKKNMTGQRDKKTKTEGDAEVPVDIPITKPKSSLKTLEDKAREASDFILKIRKRRFKLTAGQYDVFPEGIALETAVRELDELEAEYLSLFVGRTYTDTLDRTYFYVPQSGQEIERNVMCRFSNDEGFVDINGSKGKPLVLELKPMDYTKALKQVQVPQSGPVYEDVIFYRIPEKAQLRLFYGSAAIIDAEEDILQYGPLVPFSISLID